MTDRTEEQTNQFIRKVAEKRGWVPNPDAAFVESLAEGLTVNVNRYGYYLCPCRDGEGNRSDDTDIVCPCAYAAQDIREYGQCFCGLFLSPEKGRDNPEVAQIPERRYRQS
ncbi:MAG: ferredoxin:thioredoxin reductase [Spirochaetaceae bacterium]|nr:MAG: ferredoxin:thioredoxin reductase [Spirochaetaceae bacterium]